MSKPFYLRGQWESSSETEKVLSPWDGRLIDEICLADADQVRRAVEAAHAAFAEVSRIPASERSVCLQRIAALIHARREEFIEIIIAEAGKPRSLARAEVERGEISFAQAAHEAAMSLGHALEMEATAPGLHHFGVVRRFPLGVILGITPFNFPLNLVAHKVAPAIASGNTMILKPALKTPLSALLLAEVLQEAGVPAGQINVVPFAHEHIPVLLSDKRVKMLSFTGSVSVGWKLKSQAEKMKVALELGGNAAAIVEADADWAAAVPKIVAGAFGYAGQSCISVQRILVQSAIYEDFRRELLEKTSQVVVGDPADEKTVVGPMINSSAREKVVGRLRAAQERGAKLHPALRAEGAGVLHPVVVENAPHDAEISCEEAFAPVVTLEKYETFDEALSRVNNSRFGLQAGVFTRDLNKAFQAFATLEVGGVMINQAPTFRVENMPYGGVKDSGFGREGIRYAMEEMTEPRSLVINLA
jgi:acyl-CoA reductase-like NAD-dependent aldehyde dehydrogenase